jgi:hypothetical protein
MTTAGIGGAPVRALLAHGLELWVSTVPTSAPAVSVQSVREHDAVVSAALATGRTPLPARFGQIWPSDDACSTAVTHRAEELQALLHRIAGLVEMTVCTLLPGMSSSAGVAAAPAGAATPGTAYLKQVRARAEREQHARAALEALRARVTHALGSLARGEAAEIRGSDEALALSIAYLIDRGDEAPFRRVVDATAGESAMRLVVAGPRAPYSFAPMVRQPGRERASGWAERA